MLTSWAGVTLLGWALRVSFSPLFCVHSGVFASFSCCINVLLELAAKQRQEGLSLHTANPANVSANDGVVSSDCASPESTKARRTEPNRTGLDWTARVSTSPSGPRSVSVPAAWQRSVQPRVCEDKCVLTAS